MKSPRLNAVAASMLLVLIPSFCGSACLYFLRDSRAINSDNVSSVARLPLQATPRPAEATRDFAAIVDEAVLARILEAHRPLTITGTIQIVVVLHALRLWGKSSCFDSRPFFDPTTGNRAALSSAEMLRLCLDDVAFRRLYRNATPLLIPTVYGVRLRNTSRDEYDSFNTVPGYEPHVDKMISVLGEIGVPSDFPVRWQADSGPVEGDVSSLLRDAMMRFSARQEMEFTAKAFLYYLPLRARWRNRLGDECDIVSILQAIASKAPYQSACYGTHRLQVLALALNLDARHHGFPRDLVERCCGELREASRMLHDSQNRDGSWPIAWCGARIPPPEVLQEPDLAGQIRVAGHHLEWIAMCPKDCRPPDTTVRAAIRFVQGKLLALDSPFILRNYSPNTHAVRALLLLSREPDVARSRTTRQLVEEKR